ncbi:FadR/GntR family transcriptional regulator [Nocardia amikacinitolerans]|uniref:FadR/GntR family transcriptional regulator n=1 Tax=Nocardia amikacinitolerans TaxID=756689 RepID=UPI0020A37392|nr:GntR family transcriptional regulator [Nocardia amikacinitolerans]MCP2290704.1 DNA-binding transcriptional regulator, FadR family [Nocardia amikacinitolerans]
MEFAAVDRAAVSDAVFGQLVDAILAGRIAPEEPLPSERELAETFQVNRHAVREALKRVQQSGLVRVAHGGKTRVLNWRENAGLDILSALARSGSVPPQRVLYDIAVMRRSVGADSARLCAQRADPDQLAAILRAAAAYPDATADLATVIAADHAFWITVIEGSGNLAYRLALNTLVAGYADIGWELIARLGLNEEYADRDVHRELAVRIAARDADHAYADAYRLLSRLVDALDVPKA